MCLQVSRKSDEIQKKLVEIMILNDPRMETRDTVLRRQFKGLRQAS